MKREFDIEFASDMMAKLIIENNTPVVTMCVNGYGDAVPIDSIIIKNIENDGETPAPAGEMSLGIELQSAKQTIFDWLNNYLGTEHDGFNPDYDDISSLMVMHAASYRKRAEKAEATLDLITSIMNKNIFDDDILLEIRQALAAKQEGGQS